MTEVLDPAEIPNVQDEQSLESDENTEKFVDKPLTFDTINQGISMIARTGDGMGHAFIKLQLNGKEFNSVHILSQFPHLRLVNISENEVVDVSALSPMNHLMHLDVSKNKIKKLSLNNKPYLQQILAQSNEIAELEIPVLPLLTFINLNDNRLTDLSLNDFPALKQFEARNNQIETISKMNTPRLQKLYLAQNKLTVLNEISNKDNLEMLHLRENQITTLDGFSSSNKSLTYLNLRSNQISEFNELEKLKCLENLKHLVLIGNPLDQDPYYRSEVIMRLPWILKLDKTEITPEEVAIAEDHKKKYLAKKMEEEEEANRAIEEAKKLQDEQVVPPPNESTGEEQREPVAAQ